MVASFVVYIDESGDEGFQFDKGSSKWFVLSAAITHKATDLATVKLVDTVRATLGRKDNAPLHFRGLKHEHRLPFLHEIAQADLKTVSVFIHKPAIFLRGEAAVRAYIEATLKNESHLLWLKEVYRF